MKRLFILRHAKAGFCTSDQTRPLSSRGRKDALWLGQYLKKANMLPDHILCSSAARAVETQSQLLDGAEMDITTVFRNDLYLASAPHLMHLLKGFESNSGSTMIIAHNPGLAVLFHDLAHNPPQNDRSLKFPTGMMAVLDFDIADWSGLRRNGGQVFHWVIPSDERKKEL